MPPTQPITTAGSVIRCSACKEMKPTGAFHRCITRPNGLQTRCKSCRIIDARAWRKPRLKQLAESKRTKYATDPRYKEQTRIHKARSQKKHGRRWQLKKQYGLSLEDFDRLFEFQGRVCAICGGDQALSNGTNWCVDHCHVTGKVRGILCSNCNKALGCMKDSRTAILAAAAYLDCPSVEAMKKGRVSNLF